MQERRGGVFKGGGAQLSRTPLVVRSRRRGRPLAGNRSRDDRWSTSARTAARLRHGATPGRSRVSSPRSRRLRARSLDHDPDHDLRPPSAVFGRTAAPWTQTALAGSFPNLGPCVSSTRAPATLYAGTQGGGVLRHGRRLMEPGALSLRSVEHGRFAATSASKQRGNLSSLGAQRICLVGRSHSLRSHGGVRNRPYPRHRASIALAARFRGGRTHRSIRPSGMLPHQITRPPRAGRSQVELFGIDRGCQVTMPAVFCTPARKQVQNAFSGASRSNR
jgi:hypothetical protein